jgi:copper chaperone NosL
MARRVSNLLRREFQFLHKPLNLWSRLLLLAAAITIAVSIFFPLWKMHLVAPQYADGLDLYIFSYKIQGGGLNGQHLNEINNLNHYIGMKPIQQADFTEMQIIPFMFGVFLLLALRAVVFGQMSAVIDLFMIAAYFGVFSIGAFYYRLYSYGHNLDPKAPMDVQPFTPLIVGTQKIANFTQSSYPQAGTYLLWLFMLLLVLAIWFSRKEKVIA